MNLNDTHVPPPFSAWSSYVQLCPAATEALSSATARPCFSVWSSRDQKSGKNWIFRPPFQLVSLSLQTYFNYDLNKQPAKGIEGPLVKRHTFGMPPCVPRPTKVFTTFACFRCFPSTCAIRYLLCTEARPMSQGPSPREGHGRRLYKMYQNATCPTRSVPKAIQNPKRLRRGCSPSEMLHLESPKGHFHTESAQTWNCPLECMAIPSIVSRSPSPQKIR